ncbi:MAG: FtsX-like permease family protein [Syntrophobacteraceae bacterium]
MMDLNTIVWKELWLRKSQLVSSLLAITLGIAVVVGIQTVSVVSEKAVNVKLDNLGANILVLPQAASVDDYYSADIDAPTFPESYVERVEASALPGVDNLSPKLTRRISVNNAQVILTGILPANELASKPIWMIGGLDGAGLKLTCDPQNAANAGHGYKNDKLQRKAVDSLKDDDILLGSFVAEKMNIKEGDSLQVMNKQFNVAKVIPESGTIDDNRIYAHLHTVQNLLGTGPQVSAIEIMGCCSAISDGLLGKLRNILPDTRITTIGQIVNTQIETNRLMKKISLVFLVIIVLVGAISIGNYMWANVEERRREIGMLITVGATRLVIQRLFLTKSLILGIAGGIFGYIIGTIAAMLLGPQIAGISIRPIPVLLLLSVLTAVVICLMGSYLPVRRAANLDPGHIMQEF